MAYRSATPYRNASTYRGAVTPSAPIPAGYRSIQLRAHRRTSELLPARQAALAPHRRTAEIA